MIERMTDPYRGTDHPEWPPSLAEFLLARIAEDEAAARDVRPQRWQSRAQPPAGHYAAVMVKPGVGGEWVPSPVNSRLYESAPVVESTPSADVRAVDHIARHDPARVLAECEAKRRILDLHYEPPTVMPPFTSGLDGKRYPGSVLENTTCKVCADGVGHLDNSFWDFPCDTIRALAAVYADHPDYDPAWAPTEEGG